MVRRRSARVGGRWVGGATRRTQSDIERLTDAIPASPTKLAAEEQFRHKGELAYPNLMISLSADHAAVFTHSYLLNVRQETPLAYPSGMKSDPAFRLRHPAPND